MEGICHVVYINLDKRIDRKILIEKELLRVFPYDKISRFSALYHPTPYAGCTMSHIGVLKLAKKNNWNNVLIVEDDMEWCNFTIKNVDIFENLIKNPYDVIMLGGAFIRYNKQTYKLTSASTAHCYLVSNHYYDTLIENLNDGLQKLIKFKHTDKNANDQHWKLLQAKDNWFIVVPCIATQSEGFSDNGGMVTDIRSLIGKVIINDESSIKEDITIEKIVYINLEHRKDRKQQIEKELSIFPKDTVLRFNAILDKGNGHVGCGLSHIAVLEMAIKENWSNVLIVEDDMVWNKTVFDSGMKTLTDLIKNPYDVIVLGGTDVKHNDKTHKLLECKTTTAYLVNRHYFQKLLDCFKTTVINLLRFGQPNIYAIDQTWKSLQQTDNWYVIYPALSIQSPGYSDIEKRNIDYSRAFTLKKHTSLLEKLGKAHPLLPEVKPAIRTHPLLRLLRY